MIERARRFGAARIVLSTNHPTLRHKVLLSGDSLETRRRRSTTMSAMSRP